MKKSMGLILLGIIVILAVALVGTLLYLKNQPPQERSVVQSLVTVEPMEPDLSIWGTNFPLEYSSYLAIAENHTDTAYGGSSGFSQLERDPRQVILFMGYPFSKEYNNDRGHAYALEDVNATGKSMKPPMPPAIPVNLQIILRCGMNLAWKATTKCCSRKCQPISPRPLVVPTAMRLGRCD